MDSHQGKPMRYYLEVYEPGRADVVCISAIASTSFIALNAGELIDPKRWPDSRSPQRLLRIVNLEHVFWETPERHCHKVMAFTEEYDGSREALVRDVED